MSQPHHVDLFSPEFRANPYPTYARLREEAPVHRVPLSDGRCLWLVTRYEDVMDVLKDERFVKNWRQVMSPEQLADWPVQEGPFTSTMLSLDPPDHTRLRALVHKAFTAPFVEKLRGRIQEIADQLIDGLLARGEMDLIDDYAFPLPILVIAEMLGVPAKDRDRIRRWSNALVVGGVLTKEEIEQIKPQVEAFAAYLHDLCEARRKEPSGDLISALVHAEEEGERLSQPELMSMVFLLLIAGHETTVNLIGNGMLALFEHPRELAKLREDPSLIRSAVEEFLRFNGPVETSTERFAREDIEYQGQLIGKGQQVMVVLASANHDASHFKDAGRLDIGRADNKHLAFGHGIHYCVGAPLARLEGQIGISTLLRRLPDLRLATPPEAIRWRPGLLLRGLQGLQVAFSPQA
jgi:cytochrome P450